MRDTFADKMMGSNNEAVRIVGCMDFRDEVESGGIGIGNMEEGDVLGRETMERG